MKFVDSMPVSDGLKRTAQGAAVLARVARGGNVQLYLGSEVGDERQIVRVYRPEAEVFRKDAIKTYAGVPVTLGHPQAGVSPDTWKDHAVGEVGDDVMRDGEFVRVPILIRDAAAIASVEAGTRELSMGYDAKITMQDGVTPSGEAYDAIMSDFRMNHVAIVAAARGGQDLRIGDGSEKWGACPVTPADRKGSDMTDIKLRTVVVGDEAVNTTDEGARAIIKLQKQIADMEMKAKTEEDEAEKKMAAKDAELAKRDKDIADLKAQVLDAAAVDKLVKDRADLIGKAKAIAADIVTDGKSVADIKRAVVAAKRGDVADKSEAYIDAAFDLLAEDSEADPVKKALADARPNPGREDIYTQRDADLSAAWKKGAK